MEVEAVEIIGELSNKMEIKPSYLPESSFVDLIGEGVHNVSNDINLANELVEKYARGEKIEVDEVMLAMEQAQLSLKLAVEVKNKLTAAYQELFRMQV
ncbi:flagellar hook-basal body complex protein FliE [Shewanella woodyi]|uniref:flagellar hook-basal body complex protein FliE n=1 Tax=Shewanella woodyi TaxID=60961 RepID=UPI003749324A